MKFNWKCNFLMLALVALASTPAFTQIVVNTVPFDPTNPSAPHTSYAGATIVLGATVNLPNSTDTFTFQWNYGDGSLLGPSATVAHAAGVPVGYDISNTHAYAGTACTPTPCTATITVTDTTNVSISPGSNSYLVLTEPNNLTSRVNVAIDSGLWFLHKTMWRQNTPGNGQAVNWGGWDAYGGCVSSLDCNYAGGIDATNVQAFEVDGHYETGPASDPYTDDVARGIARMMAFLVPEAVTYEGTKTITYNPAQHAVRCSDGSVPTSYGATATCAGTATPIYYNPGTTSCTSPPCNFTYDQNSNGQLIIAGNDAYNYAGYEDGMFVDALVASKNAAGIAKTGAAGVIGQTYQNIVTDLVDGIGYCQYAGDSNVGNSNGYDTGGGWQYYCAGGTTLPNYNDNSPSQWDAIGLIGANRAFGIAPKALRQSDSTMQPIIQDMNQIWTIWSQEVPAQNTTYTAYNSTTGVIANAGSLAGAFGYNQWGYEPWGPFADTPSGMVQLALDEVGRTAASSPDQRWNWAENFYRNNFCNGELFSPDSSYYYYDSEYAPRWYMYGLFSFTKAMLEHDPGGVLSPITYLSNQPGNTNPIDWYGALSATNGGTDPCDGVAQTLVSRQAASGTRPLAAASDGSWYYYTYEDPQFEFDTAWAIIMLNKTVFVACINNLDGKGTPSGAAPARIDLTWSPQTNAVSYNVLRSTTNGGPYSLIGNTTSTAFSDRSGLSNNTTYYYTIQPLNGSGSAICSSNQATITIPKGGR